MRKLKINNPCFESWDEMESVSEGKFCSQCSKKVWDFTDKTDSQISKIIETNNDICARIVSSYNKYTKVTASLY